MGTPRTPQLEIRRLWFRLSLAWCAAWFLGIAVFATVAINLRHEAIDRDLDAELALRSTAVYGLTWFDREDGFHDEILRLETDLVEGPFDLWVIEPANPPIVHFAPDRPRYQVPDLNTLAASVVESMGPLFAEGTDQSGGKYRLHAIPTYEEDVLDRAKAGVIVVGDPVPGAQAQRAFASKIVLVALGLGLFGLGLGMLLARWSLWPVALAFDQRERFLSATAHELRTPIATLAALCDSALAGDESPADALQRIAPVVSRTGEMVNELLLFTRLEAGATQPQKEQLRLDLLLEEVLAEKDHVELDAEESVLLADPGLLRVALRNLLENAILHGGPGDQTIRITVRGDRAVFEDEGAGFSEEMLALSKGSFSLAPSVKGIGIGLALTKMICQLHGGDLELSNRAGGGARATLRLG